MIRIAYTKSLKYFSSYKKLLSEFVRCMVLILDCNSEKDAHAWSNCHLIRSRAITNRILFQYIIIFLHPCAICSKLPSNMNTPARCSFSKWPICIESTFFNAVQISKNVFLMSVKSKSTIIYGQIERILKL